MTADGRLFLTKRCGSNGVIQRKLALLDTQVMNLKGYLSDVDRSTFVGDWGLRSMAEMALQVATEIVIDIAERIIALKGAGPVATAAEAIKKPVVLEILVSEKPYVDMVRFRSLIAHEYEEIDPGSDLDVAVYLDRKPSSRIFPRLVFTRNRETWLLFFSLTRRVYEHWMVHYEKQRRYRLE